MKANNAELAETRRGYSPRETADVRKELVSSVLTAQLDLSRKAPDRVDLYDQDAVERVVDAYVQTCARVGMLPNVEGAAAQLGVSRRWVYEFLEKHPDEPSARYIDRKRTEWASARIALAERGAIDSTMSIFLLLNSSLGFSNKHELSIEQPDNPLSATAGNLAAAQARILESLPEDD